VRDSHGQSLFILPDFITSVRVERIKSLLDVISTIWFILGNWWVFSSDTCIDTNPMIFYLAIGILSYSYFILSIPILFCGAVIFCLPCVLAAMRYLGIGQNANSSAVVHHGLTEADIDRIPIVIYKRKVILTSSTNANSEKPSLESNSATTSRMNHVLNFLRRSSLTPNGGSFGPSSPSNNNGPRELELSDEDAVCVICLSNYEEREQLRQLFCQHHFHIKCIDEWLRLHNTCPLCVQEVQQEEQEQNQEQSNAAQSRTVVESAQM